MMPNQPGQRYIECTMKCWLLNRSKHIIKASSSNAIHFIVLVMTHELITS